MAVVKRRKPFKLGASVVLSLPRDWVTANERELTIYLNRVGIIIPPGLSVEEVRRDVEKLLCVIERCSRGEG